MCILPVFTPCCMYPCLCFSGDQIAAGLVQLWCLYGYSLTVFIPITVSALQWLRCASIFIKFSRKPIDVKNCFGFHVTRLTQVVSGSKTSVSLGHCALPAAGIPQLTHCLHCCPSAWSVRVVHLHRPPGARAVDCGHGRHCCVGVLPEYEPQGPHCAGA